MVDPFKCGQGIGDSSVLLVQATDRNSREGLRLIVLLLQLERFMSSVASLVSSFRATVQCPPVEKTVFPSVCLRSLKGEQTVA